ncbi:hypothetical protein MMA231_01686 [Asticcacaulis sp. MM231]|uniref:hypothetical protein n=1 Tax=Asticcacaulis sp. MM231 TaxID=3157666 RepID=UPI0032D58366
MDALTFLRDRTRNKWMFGIFLLFALEPMIGALTRRFSKPGWWLGDFDALICGAQRLGQGQSPYVDPANCSGLKAASYVYAPQIGKAIAPLEQLLGPWGLHWTYGAILLPLLVFLLWYTMIKPFPDLPLHMRLMALSAIRGNPLTTGNIGGVIHALIVASVLVIRKWRWLFIAMVITAGLIKPAFLTVLVVLLYEKRPFTHRLVTFGIALALGLAGVATIFLTAGPLSAEWHAYVVDIVLNRQPGRGFFALLTYIGLEPNTLPVFLAYMVFAAIIISGGLALVEWGPLTVEERCFFGLGVAQLINPRLFEYNFDLYLLYPAMAMVVMMAEPLNRKAFVWLSWLYVITMGANFWISIIGINILRYFPGTFLISCVIYLTVVGLTLHARRETLQAWSQRPGIWLRALRKAST